MPKFTPGPWIIDPLSFGSDGNWNPYHRTNIRIFAPNDVASGSTFIVTETVGPENIPLEQKANAHLISAAPNMFAALDAADTAFAVMNVQDLGSQARSCIREAWPLVQSARAKACPDGAYADAVKEAQQHEIARLDGVVKQLVDAVLYLYPMAHAHLSDKAELQKIMQLVKEVRGDEA